VNGRRRTVLIAGIGGASLGTELLKCLAATSRYRVFGCDVSPLAYGHSEEGFENTFTVPRDGYVHAVSELALEIGAEALIPGGEEPMVLLARDAAGFESCGTRVLANTPGVVALCSDKGRCLRRLAEMGVPVPVTRMVRAPEDLAGLVFPVILKPATGSGGSDLVFLAGDDGEAGHFARWILASGREVVAQEYIAEDGGEFTVGVLHRPDGGLIGSVALRRLFHTKLSVAQRNASGLISSGYSQGRIEEFRDVRNQAERIAGALDSRGPCNVQGRVRDGVLLPFEVNPRFSASTYLRTLAGFNEVDLMLRAVLDGEIVEPGPLRPGWYLRSLTEKRVESPREAR